LAHRKELEGGIDPRRSIRPGARQSIGTTQSETPKPASASVSSIGKSVRITDNPIWIELPDATDKHSVHFLVYEFVEHYLKPHREVPEDRFAS
jgi:hypothetical protein